MTRVRPLRARDVERALRTLGYAPMPKRGKGSHQVYRHPASGRLTTLSWHGGGEQVPKGTLLAILGDIGLAWEEFERLL